MSGEGEKKYYWYRSFREWASAVGKMEKRNANKKRNNNI